MTRANLAGCTGPAADRISPGCSLFAGGFASHLLRTDRRWTGPGVPVAAFSRAFSTATAPFLLFRFENVACISCAATLDRSGAGDA